MLRVPERHLERLTLELGAKVFTKLDAASIRRRCREALDGWRPLIADAQRVCVLLWIGDGDEIFNWRGRLDDRINWNDTIGFNNQKYGAYPRSRHYEAWPPNHYMPHPPRLTYRHIRRIVQSLKAAAREMFGIALEVGETVDAGPEFVESEFKFERHPELLKGGPKSEFPKSMVFLCCYAKMKADRFPYAGFPRGLPAGTTFGTFLGRQYASLAKAIGFDYLWLSNGFGLTHYAWSYLGEVFDGLELRPEIAPRSIREFSSFWRDFRRECPRVPIEIRGTNYSIGMDAAAHGIDVREIYKIGKLANPAPNPPWGSANLDLEMVSQLSRISSTPKRGFPLRFYFSDSWFAPVPWTDYYHREPFDIYCPMSAGRLNARGKMETPTDLLLMPINSGFGELLPTQAAEAIPHLRRAFHTAPDAAGPLVWVYPFDEYQDSLHEASGAIGKAFFGDWYVSKAIACGLPLNTVITAASFRKCMKSNRSALQGRVLVVPTPAKGWQYVNDVLAFAKAGGQVVFYGSLDDAPAALRKALNVRIDEPIAGRLDVRLRMDEDDFEAPPRKRPLRHIGRLCDGGVCEVLARPSCTATQVRAAVAKGRKRRVYALVRRPRGWNGGAVAWIRGTLPFDARPDSLEPKLFGEAASHNAGAWLRYLLRDFGYDIRHDRPDLTVRPPMLFVHRWNDGFVINGHAPQNTVTTRLSFPDGAPILTQRSAYVQGGEAAYTFDRTIHFECQVFVRQRARSLVSYSEQRTVPPRDTRCFRVSGLKDATVTLYVPREAVRRKRLKVRNVVEYVIQDPTVTISAKGMKVDKRGWPVEPLLKYTMDPATGAAVIRNVTGAISVSY
ncbi:MAG TPA: hypothetical protein VNA25_09265 [Phycisphaerae bacterium]|nr:hypothetical protein [Phycisphaerae bacterium]